MNLITLSAKITILIERLTMKQVAVNIDQLKLPNMIIKKDSIEGNNPVPLFIDCGDPDFVLSVTKIKENEILIQCGILILIQI